MEATGTLSHPEFACNSTVSKIISRYGVITLSGYGISVRVDRGHLILEDGIGNERRRARLPRVGHDLKRLVVIGSDGSVTLSSLRWLADQNVSFVMLERDGSVLASTGPVRSSDTRLRRAQALAAYSRSDLIISRELITQKLAAQERVARNKLGNVAVAEAIAKFSSELPNAHAIPSIRLLEARAANAYWSGWREVKISFPRNELPRVPEHWNSFGARISPLSGSPRLAANPANAILNYLYALLEAEARLAAAAVGLDPGMGVLHVDLQYRDSLACDLMEPVRPLVDEYVFDWLSKGHLKREWFFEQRDGNCRLTDKLTGQLSCSTSTWARAVAPFAEWTAQVLWDAVRKPPSEKTQVGTPLTQTQRSLGRGKVIQKERLRVPTPESLCVSCGASIRKGKYCSECSKAAARESLISAAVIGRQRSRTLSSRLKMAEKQLKHSVDISLWDERTLPEFLTEDYYRKLIQPSLRKVSVRRLAESIAVSKSYAHLVRCGRAIPHPRHWQRLADLVGFSE